MAPLVHGDDAAVALVFLGGDGPLGYPIAMQQLPLVMNALRGSSYGDLTKYVVVIPGWDSVFYGWEPAHEKIPGFATAFRALCATCFLGIEHGTGHIPLGEGDSDWVRGGDMQGYDLLLSEFNDDQFDDTVWQAASRLLGPAYRPPPDEPLADDPGVPFGATNGRFYLRDGTERGRFYTCAFEFGEYGYVRSQYDAAHVQQQRDYFTKIGYTCGG